MKRPNILFLTVDALRFDRLSLSGYKYNTSPTIDRLSKNSLWCSNAFALAPSTQPSMPTIITSTRPLSYGGYDFGVKLRPNALPKVLKDNGYSTSHEITFPWLRSTYGYDSGVDKTSHLYNITGIVGATIHTIRSYVLSYSMNKTNAEDMLLVVSPVIRQCFDDLDTYSDERLRTLSLDKIHFPHSFFAVQDYDYDSVKAVVQKHRIKFEENPLDYINQHIVGLPKQAVNSWISKEIKFKRTLSKRLGLLSDKIITIFLFLFSKKTARLYNYRNKIYPDSSELTNRLISNIFDFAKSNKQEPFYLWAHFLDTHAPYCPGELPNWPKNAKKYLSDVGHPYNLNLSSVCASAPAAEEDKNIWNAAYDACIRYTDEQISRIIKTLEEVNLLENTLVIIAGDHGEEIGEHGEYGHRFRFYDECINVPMLFYNPSFKEEKFSGLSDLSDIAPTILGMAGIAIPESYVGSNLNVNKLGKKYIQMEVFHRGNCFFKDKPVYMAVRSETYKYIWKEWIDIEDDSGSEEVQLYDLINDKNEHNNIANSNPEIVCEMHEVIARRLAEIPEYVKNRGSKALIKTGVSKYLI